MNADKGRRLTQIKGTQMKTIELKNNRTIEQFSSLAI